MSGPEREEDPYLRVARIQAAVAFYGPQQATMRAALEEAGFRIGYSERYQQRVVELPWESPQRRGFAFRCAMSARSCRIWLLGLGEEWELREEDEAEAKRKLLAWSITPCRATCSDVVCPRPECAP